MSCRSVWPSFQAADLYSHPSEKGYTMELEFTVTPQKTFFGLDKAGGNCFTVPKKHNNAIIRYFRLGENNLQKKIGLIINDGSGLEPVAREYPAIVRLIRMNRSRPNKLKSEDLPEREVIQFDWKSFEATRQL